MSEETWTGYTLTGWSTTSGGTEDVTENTTISGITTYYAIWTANSYTVTFTTLGASVYATAGAAYQTTFGSILPTEPARNGYVFGGWSATAGGMTSISAMNAVTEDTTVYSIWTKEIYQITFIDQDGTNQTTSRAAAYQDSLGTSLPALSRDYYTFEGWYPSPAGVQFTSSTAVESNLSLYAKWTAIVIKGIVTETDGTPVTNSSVTVSNSELGFSTTTSVSADGTYHVNVPKDGHLYKIEITKPVIVGGSPVDLKFEQTNYVGEINDSNPESISAKTLTGVILEKTAGNITTTISATELDKYKLDLIPTGTSVAVATDVGISVSGIFNISGLSTGTFQLVMKYYPTSGGVDYLVAGTKTVTITTSGEINIVEALIDPYGTIRDANTNALISGASVTLIYASGPSAGAIVKLPGIPDFPPSNNANPQLSDSNGEYAFMVYPTTDYYVEATKTGYQKYKSPLIHVEYDIVKHDFKMTPEAITSGGEGGGSSAPSPVIAPPAVIDGKQRDLAIALLSDKMKLLEDKSGKFIVRAVNKSEDAMQDVYVKVTIPAGFDLLGFTPGGSQNGRDIVWNLGTLDPNTVKTYTLDLKSGKLDQAKLLTEFTAKIGTNQNIALANPEDDLSLLKIMQFSNRYQLSDKPYVTGYPDGNVKPLGQVTRAEVAAMFTRLLQLTNDPSKAIRFADVPDTEWYASYMEIMAEKGIFKGYEDGTIHPNQPITRAELGIAIARLLGISRENFGGELFLLSSFQDTNQHWAAATIEELYRFKIVSGDGATGFRPDNSITREESMKMINRLFYRGPLNGTDPSFPDNNKGYWSFGEIEEAARDHSYQVNEDGSEQLIH